MLNRSELLEAYYQLTGCCHSIWNWRLTCDMQVLDSDCPHPQLYSRIFGEEMRQKLREHIASSSSVPVIFIFQALLCWIAAFETEGEIITAVHLKGPFLNTGHSGISFSVSSFLKDFDLEPEEKTLLGNSLSGLASMTSAEMFEYAQMLHYCLHGQSIDSRKIDTVTIKSPQYSQIRPETDQFDRSGYGWYLEQLLLKKIRKGDLTIGQVLARMNSNPESASRTVPKTLEQHKQSNHVLLTLVSRAAVEGGMVQKTAFSLCSEYRSRINACRSQSQLALLGNEMILDYTRRVHEAQKYADCTPAIRLCCEYIDTHPTEKLSLELLSQKSGYTRYHLSRKFHTELGCSITEYIQNSKIEHAIWDLVNTDKTMEEISAGLGFGNRTYFTSLFRKHTGQSPTDYRKEHRLV